MSQFAVIFPGQGSQSVGMLDSISGTHPEILDWFSRASHLLDYDLWSIVQKGPEGELDKTAITQPALLVSSYAIWQIIKPNFKTMPAALAGHSLGEYTALLCADALSFESAVQLVAARGEYMQAAVAPGEGAMAAIVGLNDEAVADICRRLKTKETDVVTPANFNSVGQVVIAGNASLIDQAVILAKEAGAKMALKLPVSVPSHCQLMQPAALSLAKRLEEVEINLPKIPVISNADVTPYQSVDAIKAGLVKQLTHPVRWVETIHYLQKQNINTVIECGPGKVLAGLVKRIDKSIQVFNSNNESSLEVLFNQVNEVTNGNQ